MDLSKKMIGIIIGSLLIILLAVIFWLKPNTESTETPPASEKAHEQQMGQLAFMMGYLGQVQAVFSSSILFVI